MNIKEPCSLAQTNARLYISGVDLLHIGRGKIGIIKQDRILVRITAYRLQVDGVFRRLPITLRKISGSR